MSNDSGAIAVIEVRPLAERLRFKNALVKYTLGSETSTFRVTSVSMPDSLGRCTLTLEPTA